MVLPSVLYPVLPHVVVDLLLYVCAPKAARAGLPFFLSISLVLPDAYYHHAFGHASGLGRFGSTAVDRTSQR